MFKIGTQALKKEKRIFTDLTKPLKAGLGKGWRKVAGDITGFSLYKKGLDIKQIADPFWKKRLAT